MLKLCKMSYEIKPTVSTLGYACACAVAVNIVYITKYHCYICAAGKMGGDDGRQMCSCCVQLG